MSQDKELTNPHSDPTTSRIANVVSSPPNIEHCDVPLPPRNPNMTYIKQYSLPSLECRPRTTGIVETTNQHIFTTMTHITSENRCLQSYRNKMKLALTVTALVVVMVTVPAVYISVNNKKTGIHNSVINQNTEIRDIDTSSVINQKTEIHNTNSSGLTRMTEVPTVNSHLAFNGM